MNRKNQTIPLLFLLAISTIVVLNSCQENTPEELPNILWLTSEDNSPLLGCYGNEFATTPNLDRLASEGFLYSHAYANAPVCAPTRNTILTGVYASSGGNQHMRSYYPKSDIVVPYPLYLRQAGYYCTNNSKTDYNLGDFDNEAIWDECSKTAHYKNRKEGQPFFAVFNSTISHESSIHKWIPNEKLRHNPDEVPLPPYHPATREIKHDWAQYYDKVEDMDAWVGEKLQELDEAGLADNTIVFYYGDHGGVLARSKRYVYETGTRVPFIVRIPEKYKHLFPAENTNVTVDRLISFVDLVPTLLSIVGIKIPDYLQGHAFLGAQKTDDPEYAFMFRGRMDERYDMSRAVRDNKYRYIRNYMPYRIYGQPIEYLFRAPSIVSWQQAYLNGECNPVQSAFWQTKPAEELYDTENDPWEVNNLADNEEYADVLRRMRTANKDWMTRIYDTGFIPEAALIERANGQPMYDYMRSGAVNMNAIMNAAEIAANADRENLNALKDFLNSDESAIRYWGATGLLILGEAAEPALPELKKATTDVSANVAVVAAEALHGLGAAEIAEATLLRVLQNPNEFARCHALNVIDCLEVKNPAYISGVVAMVNRAESNTRNHYDMRAAKRLIEKWEIDAAEYQLEFDW